jgi:hypothetical protein
MWFKEEILIKAACHCGAVRFEIASPPEWVLDCNCTICRRYGALWSYYHGMDQAKLLRRPVADSTSLYTWNDHEIAFHHCKTCGCITHMQAVVEPRVIFCVNARMMVGLDPAGVRLRQVDNGHTGYFWTKSVEPVIASRHPPMPAPGPDDWR